MSLLTICEKLAYDVGMEAPTQIITAPDRRWKEAASMGNATGDELARRVDWGALHSTATLTGDGTNKVHDLGATYDRITPGIAVTSGGVTIRPLSRAEWASLDALEGDPRYFLLEGQNVTLWPYLATGVTATVQYQTNAWCSNGTAEWAADTDTSLIDEDIFAKGLIVRWRRQKGMAYDDQEAEYEAALAEIASFDDRSRI